MFLFDSSKVLVVDDSREARLLIKGCLFSIGIRNVIEAKDAEEALAILEKDEHSERAIKLLLVDWELPRLSGIDLLHFFRQSQYWSKVPFILITGNDQIHHLIKAAENSVTDYIIKPVTVRHLKLKLQYLFEKLKTVA